MKEREARGRETWRAGGREGGGEAGKQLVLFWVIFLLGVHEEHVYSSCVNRTRLGCKPRESPPGDPGEQ